MVVDTVLGDLPAAETTVIRYDLLKFSKMATGAVLLVHVAQELRIDAEDATARDLLGLVAELLQELVAFFWKARKESSCEDFSRHLTRVHDHAPVLRIALAATIDLRRSDDLNSDANLDIAKGLEIVELRGRDAGRSCNQQNVLDASVAVDFVHELFAKRLQVTREALCAKNRGNKLATEALAELMLKVFPSACVDRCVSSSSLRIDQSHECEGKLGQAYVLEWVATFSTGDHAFLEQ